VSERDGRCRLTTSSGGERSGFTLVEVIVVLILLAVSAALVAPAILFPEREATSALVPVVNAARQLAARRGETLYLQVASDGKWRVFGAASLTEGAITEGRLEDNYEAPAFTLVIAPIGSCGFDVASANVARVLDIDPLTCEVRSP
jgi:prepilin-type N-terminal cleavage/methylation domain-containing protein